MRDASEEEAIALLSEPSICEDAPYWGGVKDRPWLQSIEHGLMRVDGSRAGLIVAIDYSYRPNTQTKIYQFGIFRGQLGGRQRVYQLTVKQTRKPIKDQHALPHEHFGDKRLPCPAGSSSWSFDDALAYFAERTNLTFRPQIEDPSVYRLKP